MGRRRERWKEMMRGGVEEKMGRRGGGERRRD